MAYTRLGTIEATGDGDRLAFGVESASDATAIDTAYPDLLPFSVLMNAQYMADASNASAYFAVKDFDGSWKT